LKNQESLIKILDCTGQYKRFKVERYSIGQL